ncbi:hypothetical protein RHGRI_038045 [Rhododendron griersonianum]|uniref:Uncharacterized protein n=1 Tax=Rhododendron griersonianum TaxID=479676 RepID=A0AAV6HXN5_9ERIC|nr:hypothetical protein RHGRI_038045 [Rhododendron griersonianum]
MVVCAPFVRWDIIRHGSDGSARAGVYYLETAQGERVICAVAIPCDGNRMTYRPFDSFLEDYRTLLPSSSALEWNFTFQLAAWLDGIVYYSFLRYGEEGIGSCWHFSSVSPGDVAQRLPLGLRRHFLPSGPPTWILVLHGYRIWPIEIINQRFGDGWDKFRAVHQLKADFKVRICIVGSFILLGEFEARLREAFNEFDLEEMVIKMGGYVWNIPISDLQLDVQAFDQFFGALDLGCLDFVLVLMLSTMEFRVVVFPVDHDIDRIYSWF